MHSERGRSKSCAKSHQHSPSQGVMQISPRLTKAEPTPDEPTKVAGPTVVAVQTSSRLAPGLRSDAVNLGPAGELEKPRFRRGPTVKGRNAVPAPRLAEFLIRLKRNRLGDSWFTPVLVTSADTSDLA